MKGPRRMYQQKYGKQEEESLKEELKRQEERQDEHRERSDHVGPAESEEPTDRQR